MMQRALFPLNALLCPGGRISLRVFETRYLDMVRDCLKNDVGFVVVLLKRGKEASYSRQSFYELGTLAKVVDFDQGNDTCLHLVAEGQERLSISEAVQDESGLWMASVKAIDASDSATEAVSIPYCYEDLAAVLRALVEHPMVKSLNLDIDFEDSLQVGFRLAELLPLDNHEKQYLFELDDPVTRLEKISEQLNHLNT